MLAKGVLIDKIDSPVQLIVLKLRFIPIEVIMLRLPFSVRVLPYGTERIYSVAEI
jgi:hypothetical protein